MVLKIRISKAEQVSNWEADKLTERQLRYAATDAWACLEIFQKLKAEGFLDELFG
jgi:ribonuclease D